MKYVIIGNSAAGIAAIEGIRSRDESGEIVLVSDEKHFTYGRPLISYYLMGATDTERMRYRPADFYEKNNVRTIFGVRAEQIDAENKKVMLSDGKTLCYDKLLVATGSRPFVPPMEGLDGVKKKFSFMNYDDALALEKAIGAKTRVLIVGAGLIGLKCCEGIAERVKSVTVVDLADHVLASILDEYGAGIVQRALEEKGVKFYLSDSVAHFEKTFAMLKSGARVEFDVLVVAVGVRPNVELVKSAGGEVRRGIAIDTRGETSVKDVYAAGDCTESRDIVTGEQKILALMPNAYLQGHCAGVNMAGGDEVFDKAVAMNAIGFFGTHVLTAGVYTGESYEEKTNEKYKKLFYKDGYLNGFILVNEPERAGIYTSLIRERTPLSDIDFELIKKSPALMAFSVKARAEKLARRV